METRPNDEIDLTELAVSAIRFLKKHLKLILAFTVIGGILGFSTSMVLPRTFDARLTLSSDLLNDYQSNQIAQNLKGLIDAKEYPSLASRLGVDERIARKIQSLSLDAKTLVSVKNYFKETGYNNEGNTMDKIFEEKEPLNTTLTLTLSITDNRSLPELQKGLVTFFSSSEYVTTKARQQSELYNTLIKEIDTEINSLDSLKSRLVSQNYPLRAGEMVIVDPSNLSLNKIKLKKERLAYSNALELINGMQVIDSISAFEKRLTKKLVLLGLIGGFILSFIFIYLSFLLKKVNSPEA